MVAKKIGAAGELHGHIWQVNPPTGEVNLRLKSRMTKNYKMKLVALDPNQYALFYGCGVGIGAEYVFVYSREKTLPYEVLKKLNKILRSSGVHMLRVKFIDQYNC